MCGRLFNVGDKVRHVGDLGNIVANESGVAEGVMKDAFIQLYVCLLQ
jgi:Cu/Zn superoxide dismutase